MEIETHVYIPTCWGMPDIRFSVKTVGRQSPYEAAFKIYSKMRKDAGLDRAGRIPSSSFVTDEKHVVDFRAELLALLEKYNAEIRINYPPYSYDTCGAIEVLMGEESALAVTKDDLER